MKPILDPQRAHLAPEKARHAEAEIDRLSAGGAVVALVNVPWVRVFHTGGFSLRRSDILQDFAAHLAERDEIDANDLLRGARYRTPNGACFHIGLACIEGMTGDVLQWLATGNGLQLLRAEADHIADLVRVLAQLAKQRGRHAV